MAKAKKFGAFGGVFTPSILTILGVIMFLRLPWIVGQAGLWSTLGIILVAHIISASTGLSVSSVATDKRVGPGGSYFIISRSLGLPIGGTIGLALFVGLSFSVSLYLIGFAETFLSYFGFEVSLYTIRIAGSVILFLVAVITFISTSLAIKTQYLIMTAMVLSLLSVFLGRHEFVPGQPLLMPMDGALPWIALFAIFFPAVTGFEAGVSMSGDLKDPRRHIPLGTISAILVGLVVYVGLAFFFSFNVDRSLLVGDPQVLFNISWLPQLVIAGILGATLSSALGSILGAPRILQSVATDRILPAIFAKGHGASNEPRNALLLTFMIAQAGILIGELNVIARIVSIFFIITYGFLNITYAVESWAGTDFRPTFKIPGFVSIIGALACIIIMIQLDIIALIVASVVLIALFLFLKKRELTLQTGDTWNSIWASLVKTGLGRLAITSRKPKNWRPNVLLFSGGEQSRPHLVEMGKSLVGKLGIFTNFELIEDPMSDNLFRKASYPIPQKQKAGVFTRYHECRNIYEGIEVISKIYGYSGFEPNTILMGWARNTKNPEKFAWLLNNLRKQDFNTVFLDYDKTHGFGQCRSIDVWWSGHGRNLSLATTLLKFMTSSKEWRTARVRILIITRHTALADPLYSLVNQVLDNQRMRASVKLINNSVEQLPDNEIINSESRETDLCILELPDFKKQEALSQIDKVNKLTEPLRSCLLISSSSFFDEMSVKERRPARERHDGEVITERPHADILPGLLPVSREIIASEINNMAEKGQALSVSFFENGFETILEKRLEFLPEVGYFAERFLGGLSGVIDSGKPGDQDKALLRLLNDFSYHSQRMIRQLKDELLPHEQQALQNAISAFISGLTEALAEVPEKIWIRQSAKEIRMFREDKILTRIYKLRKKLIATVRARPVSYKVRFQPAFRHFVFHKRLEMMQVLMKEFAVHAFQQITDVKKILIAVHEAIEKMRRGSDNVRAMSEYIRLDRQRLNARIGVMQDENKQFFYSAAQKIYQTLLDDLNQLCGYLDKNQTAIPGVSFKNQVKQDEQLMDTLQVFPDLLQKNLDLYINKAALDFTVLALKSRINSKIEKYNHDFSARVKSSLLSVINEYHMLTLEDKAGVRELKKRFEKLDHSKLKVPSANQSYEALFEEIRDLLKDVTDKIEIGGEHFAEDIPGVHFPEPEPVVVHLRKVLSMYLGKEFIDPFRKAALEADQQLNRTVVAVKDLVRLMNFSLTDDENNEAEADQQKKEEQRAFMIRSFHSKLREEENLVLSILENLKFSFSNLLKIAFDPLSSATMGKSGLALASRRKDEKEGYVLHELTQNWRRLSAFGQRQLVNLLYSKSEQMLWFHRMKKSTEIRQPSNKDILDFVEKITPLQSVLKDLPFYYSSLFSGQSGIGDDFWVGMKEQKDLSDQAIKRFKSGHSGALIITGARSSGKSSLSKMMAGKHFASENIHQVRAPQGCTANLALFTSRLQESLNATNQPLNEIFSALPAGKTIIIQDLALWWERKPGGNAVIECIKSLIDKYGGKCLFIITVNSNALPLIDHWSKLKSYALATIVCTPFDARELQEMIMLRHRAGGMRFHFNKKAEDNMSAWDFARLFNKFFDQSYGNPGTAILLWLASIKKVVGKSIYLESLALPSTDLFNTLTKNQWFYILQFVIHRRFALDTLAENINVTRQEAYTDIRELMRAGILVERFQGVYAIKPGLDLYLTEQLKKMNHL